MAKTRVHITEIPEFMRKVLELLQFLKYFIYIDDLIFLGINKLAIFIGILENFFEIRVKDKILQTFSVYDVSSSSVR